MNVLTQQKHSAVVVLLDRGISQHEIQRKTGVDRKTVRKIAQSMADGPSNSPMAVNQHGKLTKDPGKSALKSCHSGDVQPSGAFAGAT